MGNTTVLMSSPEYFKVEYSINPWMIEGVEVDLELAKQQWENLKSTIEDAGAVGSSQDSGVSLSTAIDISTWPEDALTNVALRFLGGVKLPSEEVRTHVATNF